MVTLTRVIFIRMPGKSYRRRLESLLLCLCDVFPAVTNSLECWFCTGTLRLSPFQIVARLVLLLSSVYWAVQWSWFARVNALCNLSHKKSREVAASLPVGGKKVSLRRYLAKQKKCVVGHPIARTRSYCLLPDTFWLRTSIKAFNVGSVKFINSLSPPSIVKKVRTGSKSSQGT